MYKRNTPAGIHIHDPSKFRTYSNPEDETILEMRNREDSISAHHNYNYWISVTSPNQLPIYIAGNEGFAELLDQIWITYDSIINRVKYRGEYVIKSGQRKGTIIRGHANIDGGTVPLRHRVYVPRNW